MCAEGDLVLPPGFVAQGTSASFASFVGLPSAAGGPHHASSEHPTGSLESQEESGDFESEEYKPLRTEGFKPPSKEPSKESKRGETPNDRLFHAAREGSYKKLLLAISSGADVNKRNVRAQTSVMLVATSHGESKLEALRFLVDVGGCNLEAVDDMGWTALMHASRNNQKESVALLLERRATVKHKATDGKTAVMLAAMEGATGLVAELVAHHAAPDRRDESGMSALCYASETGRADLVAWLLQKHADPKKSTNDGSTTLHIAAHFGHVQIAKILLKGNASLNAKDVHHATPLILALKAHREDFGEWLMAQGVEVADKTKSGEDAVSIAQAFGMHGLVYKIVHQLREGPRNISLT